MLVGSGGKFGLDDIVPLPRRSTGPVRLEEAPRDVGSAVGPSHRVARVVAWRALVEMVGVHAALHVALVADVAPTPDRASEPQRERYPMRWTTKIAHVRIGRLVAFDSVGRVQPAARVGFGGGSEEELLRRHWPRWTTHDLNCPSDEVVDGAGQRLGDGRQVGDGGRPTPGLVAGEL